MLPSRRWLQDLFLLYSFTCSRFRLNVYSKLVVYKLIGITWTVARIKLVFWFWSVFLCLWQLSMRTSEGTEQSRLLQPGAGLQWHRSMLTGLLQRLLNPSSSCRMIYRAFLPLGLKMWEQYDYSNLAGFFFFKSKHYRNESQKSHRES